MAYRTMEQSSEPTFTLVEKLFLSGKWYNRLYGHSLILGKVVGKIICIVGGISALLAAIVAIAYGIDYGAEKLIAFFHLNKTYVFFSCMGLFLLAVGLSWIGDLLKENRLEIERKIQNKIYKEKHNEK